MGSDGKMIHTTRMGEDEEQRDAQMENKDLEINRMGINTRERVLAVAVSTYAAHDALDVLFLPPVVLFRRYKAPVAVFVEKGDHLQGILDHVVLEHGCLAQEALAFAPIGHGVAILDLAILELLAVPGHHRG